VDEGLPERPAFLPPGFGTVGHQQFVEIVAPEPIVYKPQTSGWFIVGALLLGVVGWRAVRAMRRYRRNAYRRTALRELSELIDRSTKDREAALGSLPALLKRCALSAFPRDQVAGLSGEDWLRFLDQTAPGAFNQAARVALTTVVNEGPGALENDHTSPLFQATQRWIRGHRV
jgi:hypothetical protein